MTDETNVPSTQRHSSPAATLANKMVRLYAKYIGRGPTKARTTVNTNVVLVVFGESMSRAEQNLVATGDDEAVRSMRRALERIMRPEAVAAVEETLGRKVSAFLSDIDTDANVAALVFVLEPEPESGRVQVADAD